MARKTVGVAEVRRHFGMPEGVRGRIAKATIEQYETETGNRVATGHKPEKTVTVTVGKVTKSGAYRTRKVQKPLSEVRSLAGELAGTRGVLSAKALEAASAALSDPRPEGSEAPASE